MSSKKISDNIDVGLWVDYGDHYRAAAWFDLGGYGGCYVLQYYEQGLPPFRAERYETEGDLEAAMRRVEPDLRRWNTRYED